MLVRLMMFGRDIGDVGWWSWGFGAVLLVMFWGAGLIIAQPFMLQYGGRDRRTSSKRAFSALEVESSATISGQLNCS